MATYADLNRKCLGEAEDLLRKHDLPQASEKLWGAFVDAIKAVAEKRGQTLGTHRSIAQFVLTLEKELPELALHDAFRHAHLDGSCFYSPSSAQHSIEEADRD